MPGHRDRSGSRERKKKHKHRVRDLPRRDDRGTPGTDIPTGHHGARVVIGDNDSVDHMGHKTATINYDDMDIDNPIHVAQEDGGGVTTIIYSDPTPPPSPSAEPRRPPKPTPSSPPKPTRRPDPQTAVSVEVRVIVLRVVDIDTVNQNFLAEVFVQGKWLEPRLMNKSQQELNQTKLSKYWDPRLAITNIQGKCEDDVVWRHAQARGDEPPLVFYRRRVRAKFSEVLELKQFPVDRQELTVHVTTERTEEEVSLLEDRGRLSRVLTDNFGDGHEFHLFEHVMVNKRYIETDIVSPHAINAKLLFKCHVLRKAGYFVWNVILFIFLITLLSLTCYVIDRDNPSARLSVLVKLLLTSVAFKWTVSYSLPKISYLTYLDIYVLTCLLFLILQASLFAASALVEQEFDHNTSLWTDRIMFIASVVIFIIYNVVFVIYLVAKFGKVKNELITEEMKYTERKEAVANLVRSHSMRSTYGRKHGNHRGETDSGYQEIPAHTPNGTIRQGRLL